MADFISKTKLERFELDNFLFVSQDWQPFLALHIDKILFFSSNNFCLTDIQDQLNAQFKMINWEKISHYIVTKVDVEVIKKISL